MSIVSGVIGVLALLGILSGGMMSGSSALFFLLGAIWFQLAAIHHMMLEKKGEIL